MIDSANQNTPNDSSLDYHDTRCEGCYHWVNQKCKYGLPLCDWEGDCSNWLTDCYRTYRNKNVCWNCQYGQMDRSLYCHFHKKEFPTDHTCNHFIMDEEMEKTYQWMEDTYAW